MRTNIDIDDDLMDRAMEASGKRTKRETVNEALELLVRLRAQEGIRALRGKIEWDDSYDYKEMRRAGAVHSDGQR